jgi:hypothetical protein
MPTAFQILAAMITPAVLISACGTLVFSTSSRVSRVVDRVRSLADQFERMSQRTGEPEQPVATLKKELFLDQLKRLSRRAILLRSALTGFYVAIGLFVATSIAIGIVAIVGLSLEWLPVALELIGSAVLLYGTVLLVSEARLGVTSTLKEMDFVGALIQRYEVGSLPKKKARSA